ncbi:hypothetical protein CHU98_g8507 [Xylaria longipes]|nr:hypothetical protein CHU98_g8507 [Xylaria longipes]
MIIPLLGTFTTPLKQEILLISPLISNAVQPCLQKPEAVLEVENAREKEDLALVDEAGILGGIRDIVILGIP